MNILLVYPQYPDTFWSFKHALKFVSKKAVNPPLGLITVASLLPKYWQKKLIDLNIESLKTKDILWADYVFISAMNVQSKSVIEIIDKCNSLNKKIVAGGPLFTENPDTFPKVDHFVLNEAEITLPEFLDDLINRKPKRVYQSEKFADLRTSPLPDYSLVKISKYNTLNLQYTRGCPFNCEFCDITALLGHKVRAKSTGQIINELDAIYKTGWQKNIFFVDDNFIGDKKVLKNELLPAIIEWMESRNHPFTFSTEASINLSDDDELMDLMTKAGFSTVFIGIETTEEASLSECGKSQNKNRNLVQSVLNIQKKGLEVLGGFILGFDNDSPSIFQKQIDFIQETGIISAMVGLLNAPKKTMLYKRLKDEGRIITKSLCTGSA
ncbi:MAG: B12-binding domain-containing radical SAM protein [Chlorobi bacterium]|nr:B12-binding domain-containing radical SAM protein [Chlorobiota bacterium]